MPQAAKQRSMSKAQLEFMKEHLPAYINWLQATGSSIGIKMQPWQKRIVEALIRNGHMTADGHVTERGLRGFERRFSVVLPRFDYKRMIEIQGEKADLRGSKADLLIIDDVPETIA
jgi:hypothetical protein